MSSEATSEAGQSQRTVPRSKRGIRTRSALITAAREVFERDGYLDARIIDISRAAGVATGSFYTYFESKEEVFAALTEAVQEEMLHPHIRERTGIDDPAALIEAANREYLQSYERNAPLMGLFEQVAQIDENFRQLRIERSRAFTQRNAKMIRSLQESGAADANLDPEVTARALSAMVSRMAHSVFVLDERVPFERLVTTVNQLWINALKLDSG